MAAEPPDLARLEPVGAAVVAMFALAGLVSSSGPPKPGTGTLGSPAMPRPRSFPWRSAAPSPVVTTPACASRSTELFADPAAAVAAKDALPAAVATTSAPSPSPPRGDDLTDDASAADMHASDEDDVPCASPSSPLLTRSWAFLRGSGRPSAEAPAGDVAASPSSSSDDSFGSPLERDAVALEVPEGTECVCMLSDFHVRRTAPQPLLR